MKAETERDFLGLARGSTALAATFPLLALLGWVAESALLRGILADGIAMNPLTALCLLGLAGSALLLTSPRAGARSAAAPLAGLVVLLALVRLLEGIVPLPLRPDTLLFPGQLSRLVPEARMALGTALGLSLTGLGFLVYGLAPARHRLARGLVLPAAVTAGLALLGYLYGARVLFELPGLATMALNTSLSLLLLGIAAIALPPALPPLSSMVLPGLAGTVARWLLPAALLVPLALGGVRVYGEQAGWFDLAFGTAMFVALTAVLLTLLVLLSVHLVHRSEVVQDALHREISDSEQRLFQILEAMPVGVFVVNREGSPHYANRESGRILGRGISRDIRAEEIPERFQVYRAGTTVPYPAEQLPVARALRGEQVYAVDLEIAHPERRVPVEVWAAPVRGPDGRPELAIAAFQDITERMETQRQIEELNTELTHQVEELAAINRELETFSYSVSHDLRAPLRAIDGFSRMLTEDHGGQLTPDAGRLLQRIRHNVQRMGNLIDDLLHFSRLSRKELGVVRVDMTALARTVVEDLARGRPGLAIHIAPLPAAAGDPELLRQVWVNLVDNAIKYSSKVAHPRVEIGGMTEDGEARYWVRDNGVGFDMAYANKLFGVFQRLHTQDQFEGTGVGLAIVQRVVHRHHGRVWGEAAPDRGATFWFSLPSQEEP